MAPVHLTTVTRTQGNNRALKDGAVTPAGFHLDFEEVPVLVQAFRRMVRGLEFDVCEMAVTTYLCARRFGKPFTALPVFLVRGFHHGAIVRSAHGDVEKPADLEGRRVGVNRGYTVTTGVWARGILQDDYGVDLDRVIWTPSGDDHVAEYVPPPNVRPLEGDGSLEEHVERGDLAAAVGVEAGASGLVPLLDEPQEAAYAALAHRGLYPINHLVVVRDDVLDRHPGVAVALFDAFAQAKARYVDALRAGAVVDPGPTDQMYQRVLETTGTDPLPYGIATNEAMLAELMRHAVDQHILERPLDLEALFAAGTHDLVG
jgi:4,5-dihydroxyphthalate decarboxylase